MSNPLQGGDGKLVVFQDSRTTIKFWRSGYLFLPVPASQLEKVQMLQKSLRNCVDGFKVDQISGGNFAITLKNKGIIFFQIGAVLYMLMALFVTTVLLAAYFKGAKVFDGKAMPFWFISVFLVAEWLPLCIALFLIFTQKIFHFDYTTFEIMIKHLGLVTKRLAYEKKHIHKVLLICQSDDSSVYALKIQSGNDEHSILWMQPYAQCRWLGTVIADWSGKPLEE